MSHDNALHAHGPRVARPAGERGRQAASTRRPNLEMTPPAGITAREVPLVAILPLRESYRHAMACQIVHDSWHARGFTRSYLLVESDGTSIGYAAVGGPPREPRDIVKELYLVPARRGRALAGLEAVVATSGARRIEAQTNDPFLFPLLEAHGREPVSETLLFADGGPTSHVAPETAFRPLGTAEHARVFPHTHEPIGEWALERGGEIVATGGYALHYNPPYADLYLEVARAYQRQGLGRYFVQELRRVCREAGHLPAARCHEANRASQAALLAGGMVLCGRIVSARLAA